MEAKINGLSPELISHPSDTVFELMMAQNLTPLMLAQELKMTFDELNQFMKCKTLLSEDKFKELSRVFYKRIIL